MKVNGEKLQVDLLSSHFHLLLVFHTSQRNPQLHHFRPSSAFALFFSQSGSSEMIVQSSSTFVHHARHSGVSVAAFSFSQWHAHHGFLGYLSAMSSQLELQKAFSPASPQTQHTHIPLQPTFLSADYIWQPGDDGREDKILFFFDCQQSFQGNCVSCSSRDALYTDLRESHTNRETNQLKTNVSHQQTRAELGTVCQTRRGNEQSLATAL